MTRANKLTVYASDQKTTRIEREADDAGMSVSAYILSALEDKWTREDTEATIERTDVEERVERAASQATDEMAAMIEQQQQRTEQMADMAARSAVYSIANFELLKLTQKPPEAARTKSLQIGSRRLRDPFDPDADATADLDLAIEGRANKGESESTSADAGEDKTENENESEDDEEFTSSVDADFFERTG